MALAPRRACCALSTGSVNTAKLLNRLQVRHATHISNSSENSSKPPIDPATVIYESEEKKLRKMGIFPIGSRRKRHALGSSTQIPFEQLPYQCFQEARKILQADRAEKLERILVLRLRMSHIKSQEATNVEEEKLKARRLNDLSRHIERLKVLADINDPLVKRKFEDGTGDMNKPVYRRLARRKWESYRKKITDQRIRQLAIVPDLLPKLDVSADTRLYFGRRNVEPGQFVPCLASSQPPRLDVQLFDAGERLVTVAVIDPDVPNPEEDRHAYRCHFLASNIPISPSNGRISLPELADPSQVAHAWLPPYAQKGDNYHRLSVVILEQPEGRTVDVTKVVGLKTGRDGFRLRSLIAKESLKPIAAHIFRTRWDETTAQVMADYKIPGANIEFRRKPRDAGMPKPQLPLKAKRNRNILPSKRLWIPYHKGSTPPKRKN